MLAGETRSGQMPEVTRRLEWNRLCYATGNGFRISNVIGVLRNSWCGTKSSAPRDAWRIFYSECAYRSPPVNTESAVVELCPHKAWLPQSTEKPVERLLFQTAVEAPHSTD